MTKKRGVNESDEDIEERSRSGARAKAAKSGSKPPQETMKARRGAGQPRANRPPNSERSRPGSPTLSEASDVRRRVRGRTATPTIQSPRPSTSATPENPLVLRGGTELPLLLTPPQPTINPFSRPPSPQMMFNTPTTNRRAVSLSPSATPRNRSTFERGTPSPFGSTVVQASASKIPLKGVAAQKSPLSKDKTVHSDGEYSSDGDDTDDSQKKMTTTALGANSGKADKGKGRQNVQEEMTDTAEKRNSGEDESTDKGEGRGNEEADMTTATTKGKGKGWSEGSISGWWRGWGSKLRSRPGSQVFGRGISEASQGEESNPVDHLPTANDGEDSGGTSDTPRGSRANNIANLEDRNTTEAQGAAAESDDGGTGQNEGQSNGRSGERPTETPNFPFRASGYDRDLMSTWQEMNLRILEGQRQINDLLLSRREEDDRRSAEHKDLLAAIAGMQTPRPAGVDHHPRKGTGRKIDVISDMKGTPRKAEFQLSMRRYIHIELCKYIEPKKGTNGSDGDTDLEEEEEEEEIGGSTTGKGKGNGGAPASRVDRDLGDALFDRFNPLTDEEYEDYVNKAKNRIIITVEQFDFDFARRVDSIFNQDSLFVAAQGFRKALESGLYGGSDRFRAFLEKDGYLEACVKRHFQYLRRCYEEAESEEGNRRRERRRKRAAQRSGKNTRRDNRLRTARNTIGFRKHLPLLAKISIEGMSGDEKEDYVVNDMGEQFVRRVKRRITPHWRADPLTKLYQALDQEQVDQERMSIVEKRGAKPEMRLTAQRRDYGASAPLGLPRNCYHDDYLKGLRPVELHKLRIVEEEYDFGEYANE